MQPKLRTSRRAFTLVELIVVVAIVVLLVGVFLPAFTRAKGEKARAERGNCVNNLKMINLSFRVWANDNGGKYPMSVSTNQGGTTEVANDWLRTILVMTNELASPRILSCASDNRFSVADFAVLTMTNISYFLGLDADENKPQTLLTGDRNLTNGSPVVNGVLTVATNDVVGWTRDLHRYQGNVGLSDGSVQQSSRARLQQAVRYSGSTNATFRLAMP